MVHSSSPVGPGHELGVMFSNSKDETWSQHEHLQHLHKLEDTGIDGTSHEGRVL